MCPPWPPWPPKAPKKPWLPINKSDNAFKPNGSLLPWILMVLFICCCFRRCCCICSLCNFWRSLCASILSLFSCRIRCWSSAFWPLCPDVAFTRFPTASRVEIGIYESEDSLVKLVGSFIIEGWQYRYLQDTVNGLRILWAETLRCCGRLPDRCNWNLKRGWFNFNYSIVERKGASSTHVENIVYHVATFLRKILTFYPREVRLWKSNFDVKTLYDCSIQRKRDKHVLLNEVNAQL